MPKPPLSLPWLSSLKTSHLKLIARATGTASAGVRKDVLSERIRGEIGRSVFLHPHRPNSDSDSGSSGGGGNKQEAQKEMSVLSIDMGIQNLAFAHLLVRPEKDYKGKKMEVVLDAWHRIGVQELISAAADANADAGTTDKEILPPSAFRTLTLKTTQQQHKSKTDDDGSQTTEIEIEESCCSTIQEKNNFSPDILADNAFTLLSALISQYNPTHILIERQRFRSGGQSAVLEWSLRVGVFEGMLHAVLCTMRRLGCFAGGVWDVSPARVVQYWDSHNDKKWLLDVGAEKQKKGNEKNIKKMKINLIGEWLGDVSSFPLSSSSPEKIEAGPTSPAKIILPPATKNPADVHATVKAYLERWSGKRSSDTQWRIEKLDDLADCLLQGLTWLEWQGRRAHLAKDGVEELARMGVCVGAEKKNSKSKKKG